MDKTDGYVYVLTSPRSDCIKIGGTNYPPLKRIKEINATEPYKTFGPWSLADFRQVKEWRNVEYNLHYKFRSKLNISIKNQKELFLVPPQKASEELDSIDQNTIIKKPKIDRMFQDENFLHYVVSLFKFTGLLNWLNSQGSWTFVLFPATEGGRYFTINIGGHEVAFSSIPKKDVPQINMILVDKLILDFKNVTAWVKKHNGKIEKSYYSTALPRATSVSFYGDFDATNEFLNLDGVRRALIAYWCEALIIMNEDNKLSLHSKHHNWNAVARIHKFVSELNN